MQSGSAFGSVNLPGPGKLTVLRNSILLAGLSAAVLLVAIALGTNRGSQVTSTFAGLTIVQSANAAAGQPGIDESSARHAALAAVGIGRPELKGLAVAATRFTPGLLRIGDSTGTMRFTQDEPTNSWMVELSGPGQQGFSHFKGFVLVDATTGSIEAQSLLLYN
jgi:hypothetical protein